MNGKAVWLLAVVGLVCLALAVPAGAQGPGGGLLDEPGVCASGRICGPSGAFTVKTFPTIAGVKWEAFPANPLRPHLPASGGRVWVVAPGGRDDAAGTADAPLATIDHALELATTGDVIEVADGEYPVGLREDSLIMDTPGVTLMAANVGGATLVPRSADWGWLPAITASADDLVIDGFVIRGFTTGSGVYFGRLDSPQRNLVLRHLWIEGGDDGLLAAFPEGERTQPVVDGMLVYDVAIRRAPIGFNCGEGPCNGVRLEALSVDLSGGAAGDVGSWGDGIAVERGDNIVVFNAEVTGAGADGIDLKATRVAIANVIVHDVGRNGIKLWNDGDVINALVYYTGADAAVVFQTGGAYRILNSTVARHAWGEYAYAGTVAYDNPDQPGTLQIANSIFYQNSGALWVSGAFALDVRRTLFYGSANTEELVWARAGAELTVSDDSPATALEAAGAGCCGLDFTDPGFVDPEAGDYRLATGAYARDAGLSEGLEAVPPFDLVGHARLAGGAIDLGPYEMPE